MKTLERESIQLVLGSIAALLFLAFQSNAYAAAPTLSCETNFGEKSFTIEGKTIAFHQDTDTGRSISSISEAKSQKTHLGFRKTLYIKGHKHFIYIHNFRNLNSNDDFMAITSPKGHKMTYPINCNIVE